jgi:prepilin-type N-terminal cleavage/methylation domain-containing protein
MRATEPFAVALQRKRQADSTNRNARHRAFTLIELLVVVVIISILAAIALPNLLEAQTRAKISRTTSDLRAAATCLEAYAVDHNSYPEPLLKLSTPIAYATDAYVRDVFANPGGWFALGYVQAHVGSQPKYLADFHVQSPTDEQRSVMASHRFFVFSNGPDLKDEALENPTESFRDVTRAPGATYGYFYDPSNGTQSRGDIMRSGRFQPLT